VEAGAAIGLPLYLAQALGISFYIAGFSESVVQVFPQYDATIVGLVTLVGLTALVYFSADLALKSQFIIMAAIAASLVSFFMGGPVEAVGTPADAAPLARLSFWPVFAVFFPAVTGIEAGIAMSGDLKNPAKSLPIGTILAVLTGYVVYLAIPIFLHYHVADPDTLLRDPLVMQQAARWGQAILVGVWAASLSSAMGALLGAPRTLQALARDRVVPRWIGRGYGKGNDPRLATAISFAIGMTGILLGDLNVIAPILSMFFLTSYGVLNLSAGMEELILNPSWRPKFRVPAWVALTGFFACLGVMLMIDAGETITATVVCAGIYYVMKRRSIRARWGDMRVGFMMFATRQILYRMEGMKLDERTWKPNLLVLSGSPAERWYLIEVADAIAQGRSFVTVAAVIPEKDWTAERSETLANAIRSYLKKRNVPAFIRTVPASNPFTGAAALIRSYGFGPISPNTILVGETEHPSSFVEFARLIQLIARSQRNLVIVRQPQRDQPAASAETREAPQSPEKPERDRRIDVWWSGKSPNRAFLVAVAFLLHRSEEWDDATLCFKTIADSEEAKAEVLQGLKQFLTEARIPASSEVLVRGQELVYDVISRSSRDADLVFLGMRSPTPDESVEDYSRYYEKLLAHTEDFPATALVIAGEKVDFKRIFMER
jgi:amino acid transporter